MFGWFRKYVRKIGIFGLEVEFRPPTEPVAHNPAPPPPTHGDSKPVSGGTPGTDAGNASNGTSTSENAGMTFDAVIRAIREQCPEAVLGRTVEQGQYFERARHLTNYQLHTIDPPCYRAVQANGKTMWLYLGKGGKICCGDKE